MTDQAPSSDPPPIDAKNDISTGGMTAQRARRGAALTAIALGLVFAVAIYLVFRFVNAERERDLQVWQTRLGIVAESRAAAIGRWLAREKGEIEALAQGTAIRLYVTQLIADPKVNPADTAEGQYLSNVLKVIAARSGYALPPSGANVPANVKRVSAAGIAILDKSGKILVATPFMPKINANQRRKIIAAAKLTTRFLDMHSGHQGRPTIGYAAPIFRVQGGRTKADLIGHVVGIKPAGSALFRLLKQPGSTEGSARAILLRRAGAVIEYLSPTKGAPPLKRKMAINTPNFAGAVAILKTGGFAVARDHRGIRVLVTSRRITGAPWVLKYKIDAVEALAPSEARRTRLLIILLLALALGLAAIFALWRHGASRRAAIAAQRYRETADRLEHQRDFLRVLTDNQPNAIYIVDEDDVVRFANAPAAEDAGVAKEAMVGKTLASLIGPQPARRIERLNRTAIENGAAVSDIQRTENLGEDGEAGSSAAPRIVQSKHIPLAGAPDMPKGVLVVEEDVTEAITEREARTRNLRALVQSLVGIVDQRDPNAANHSARVAQVARAVASEMGLEDSLVETAGFAGDLMNIGKILVPEKILTKPSKLTKKELEQVHQALAEGAELLEDIEFDGPVVETLRQSRERWDGAGNPQGLAGNDILVTARIVATANAFVAMVSPRAHRPGMDFDGAVEALLAETGANYDRKVVAALINHLDNRGGREAWRGFRA